METASFSEVRTDEFGSYTEVVEDAALVGLHAAGMPVSYNVIIDEWSDDFSVRTIKVAMNIRKLG